MKTRILVLLSIVGVWTSCDFRPKEYAKQTIDSLKAELILSRRLTETMNEVGVLIDSIDANRKVLHTRMVEGATYESYVARMRDINQYIKRSQSKIEALEKTAHKSKNNAAFASALNKLKADLEVRNHELAALTEQVKMYQNENQDLIRTVSLQKAEIQDKLNQIRTNQEATAKLEEQVKELLVKSKLDEGEAYFARAKAVEETANRTKFAPRKKRNTMKEALEFYKMAHFYGKDEAQAKITELEKRLHKRSFII